MTDTPEKTPAFDTLPIRDSLRPWSDYAVHAKDASSIVRESLAEMALTEEVPIQMVTAASKLAENYIGISEQTLGMVSNFTRWLDAIDGKHVAEEAGGADGLGA